MGFVSIFFIAFALYGYMTCESTNFTTVAPVSQNPAPGVEKPAIKHPSGREIPFECRNITLGSHEFEMLGNGTLRDQKLKKILKNSSYRLVNDTITICAPLKEKKGVPDRRFCKPIYFSLLAFIFQLQVPLVICLNRGLHRIAPLLLASFFACLVSAYYIVPVDLWVKNPAFFSIWFSIPSILNFISLTCIAWMNLLSSDLVVNYLKSLDHIAVTRGNVVVIKRYNGILQLSVILGFGIAAFTFVMIHSGTIEIFSGLPREFDSLDRMLPFFFPTVLVLTLVNICFFAVGRAFPLKTGSNDFSSRLHEKNWIFFHLHMFVVANWIFGCLIVVGNMWWVWNMFASLSIFVPALILRAACVSDRRPQPPALPEKVAAGIPDGQSALLTIKVDNPPKTTI